MRRSENRGKRSEEKKRAAGVRLFLFFSLLASHFSLLLLPACSSQPEQALDADEETSAPRARSKFDCDGLVMVDTAPPGHRRQPRLIDSNLFALVVVSERGFQGDSLTIYLDGVRAHIGRPLGRRGEGCACCEVVWTRLLHGRAAPSSIQIAAGGRCASGAFDRRYRTIIVEREPDGSLRMTFSRRAHDCSAG